MPEDFWPEIAATPIKAPATILAEQAPLLGQKTQNVVVARVRRLKMKSPERVGHAFEVVAPALNNYAAILFKIGHDLTDLYPVRIYDTILPLVEKEGQDEPEDPTFIAENEEQFVVYVRDILKHPRVLAVIQALMAQSEGGVETEPTDDEIPF